MGQEMNFEIMCLQMITSAGEAKSNYMEALDAAKEKDYDKAQELIKSGDACFVEGHKMHTELIQKECAGDKVVMTLLLTHVEDQMNSAETIKILVEQLIEVYQKING